MKLTGGQALVRCLEAERTAFAFGIAGGKLGPLLHALAETPSVRYVGLRHEAAGPMMAAAAFARTGQMAVALGEMGPGGLNLASGMGVAYNNNLALLAITTNQHRAASYPHAGMFMDLDSRALFAPVTKWNAVVTEPGRIPELVRTACREALTGRPGPVHLDIPHDVLAAEVDFADGEFDVAPPRTRAVGGPRPNRDGVALGAARLAAARRPLIVVGGGAVLSGAEGEVRQLAALLGAPVVPTQMALGTVATDSPYFVGHGGLIGGPAALAAIEQADVVLSVGCRYSSWMWDEDGALLRRTHRHINVNIDPSALGAPALHEVGLHADAREALLDLIEELGRQEISIDSGWLASLRDLHATYSGLLIAMAAEREDVMHPAALATAIAEAMPDDALAVYDGGHTSFWSNDLTPVHGVRTRFHDPGMAHLGFGLPYAIALQLTDPDRRVFNITGDGGFGFTLQELDTARRYELPVVTVIHNNESWGVIRQGQMKQFGSEFGTALEGTDYAAIARAFGCHGERVSVPDDVAPAIERGLASGLPAVIDCRTRFVPHPAMAAFGSMNRFGATTPTVG
jgi:thiamine pyrophosphate-dependent acetolactate synthase large subunit-like protein